MYRLIIFIFMIHLSVFAEKLDIELFGDMTRIKIAINSNSKISISENYFKRYIDLSIENYPKGFKKEFLLYEDNIIDKIDVLIETRKMLKFRIYITKVNFFYDYKIENNYLRMPIGIGLKIIPLKTNHNLVFVPYFFNVSLSDKDVQNLELSPIYSEHKIAKIYNKIIELYSQNEYERAKEALKELSSKNIDKDSLIILKYLDAELDFRLRNKTNDNCKASIVKFKELIESNEMNSYNDRAVVFMYLCSKENDAMSDSVSMIKKIVNEYTNSPYYYRFLYEDALNDYENARYKKFKNKLKQVMKRSNDPELKLSSLYKIYGFHLKNYDVAEAYELVLEHAKEYSMYSSYKISPYFLLAYGDALFFNRLFAKARKIYKNVIKLTPKISLVRYSKVRISDTYLYEYDYDKVEEYFKKNEKFFNGSDIGSKLAKIRLDEYEGNFYSDDTLAQKFSIMQEYLKDNTLREELIFREGQIYFYREDFLDAYLKIKKLMLEYPKTTLILTAKEMIDRIIYSTYLNEYKNKKYTRVYQLYSDDSEIIKLHPEYYSIAYMIINSLGEIEQYTKLIQLINYILTKKMSKDYRKFFLYKLAHAYLMQGKYYKSIHVLKYIHHKDKSFKRDYRSYKFLGDYNWRKKLYNKSMKNYNIALKMMGINDEEKFYINNKIANYFFKKRAYSPALKYYIRANKIKKNKEILLKIGQIYYYMEEFDKSIIVLSKYLNIYNNSELKNRNDKEDIAQIHYRIGLSWIKNGNYNKGMFILENFIKREAQASSFWVNQIKKMIVYEKYNYKLKKIKEITIDRSGL